MHRIALPLTLMLSLLSGCIGLPDKVQPITDFDAERYLGTWYEIARLDHSFERGLSQVTATYARRPEGGISVTNRGYSNEDKEWDQAEGIAYFVDNPDIAHLKVSFFRPFYASYVVFDLQPNYERAYVSGFNENYLWLLSRSPTVDQKEKDRFIQMAREKGFETEEIIWVQH